MNLVPFLFAAKDLMLPCLNKQLLGMECPGCGIQRSVWLLFQGEFVAAFKMYPAVYPILGLFAFLLLDRFFRIKHSNTISIVLMLMSVVMILANFLYKIL